MDQLVTFRIKVVRKRNHNLFFTCKLFRTNESNYTGSLSLTLYSHHARLKLSTKLCLNCSSSQTKLVKNDLKCQVLYTFCSEEPESFSKPFLSLNGEASSFLQRISALF